MLAQALELGSTTGVADRIAAATGERLVELPATVKRPKAVIYTYAATDGAHRFLFWKPRSWIADFYYGYVGRPIVRLQQRLRLAGRYDARIDGIVGKYTIVALTGFQRALGLPMTGRPDAATQYLLAQRTGPLRWTVQAGHAPSLAVAEKMQARLQDHQINAFIRVSNVNGAKRHYAVRLGPYGTKARAEAARAALTNKTGLSGALIELSATGM